MQIVITGANFGNKGAQSMLFTTIAMIRQNYPDAKIFFAHRGKSPVLKGKFLFEEIYFRNNLFKVSPDNLGISASSTEMPWGTLERTMSAFENADLILDISGFTLGSKWGVGASKWYLNKVNLARELEVPIILMPQSFGPFEFDHSQELIDKMMAEIMPYPKKIFAREQDGFNALKNKYKLKNVSVHPDLVLAGPQTDLQYIYKNVPKISVPKVLNASCVGIVPNLRSFDHSGRPWQTLQAYYEIINFLLKEGKMVYLFRHSSEDLVPCKWLKSLFADDERVILWENNFSCFEYDKACRQFDFLIVGRFHGVVHAYRNNTPCLLMGWAVKYRELAQLMNQSQYIFDFDSPKLDTRKIFAAIRDMENNLELNKKILSENLTKIQKNCKCFDTVKKFLDKVAGRRS